MYSFKKVKPIIKSSYFLFLFKENHHDGLSGNININNNGLRVNYSIHIYKKAFHLPLTKVSVFC